MKYDSAGTSYDLVSGGMFHIDFKTPEGDELKIKGDQGIKVDLASDKDGDFNYYKLEMKAQLVLL